MKQVWIIVNHKEDKMEYFWYNQFKSYRRDATEFSTLKDAICQLIKLEEKYGDDWDNYLTIQEEWRL